MLCVRLSGTKQYLLAAERSSTIITLFFVSINMFILTHI